MNFNGELWLQAAAFLLGLLVHSVYFRAGEHHLHPIRYIYVYGSLAAIVATLYWPQGVPILRSGVKSLGLISTHLLGLYCSLFLYRAFLHPLRRFPGPIAARMFGFWLPAKLLYRPLYRVLEDLHNTYGPFVRIGPSELSVTNPEAVNIVYGFRSVCTKSPFYDLGAPVQSLHSLRNKTAHDQRRRIWSLGFSDRALRMYEKRLRVYRHRLIDLLTTVGEDQAINISQYLNWYSYDVMSDLAFSRTFGMLEASANHWAIQILNGMLKPLEFSVPIWALRLLGSIPGMNKDALQYQEFSQRRLKTRMEETPEIPDISSSLLEDLQGRAPTTQEYYHLLGDVELIIAAGSDTTAAALITVVYELARHPAQVQKLRAELTSCPVEPNGEYMHERIAGLQHLNGFINEVLRLHPPIGSIIPRQTPPEGIDIDGVHIPGNMIVSCPQWVIGRSDEFYWNAHDIIPERWYKYPDMVKHKSVYAPFSVGPYACIGKSLALMNMRTTIARIIMAFDMQMPPDDDGTLLDRNMREHFSSFVEDIHVIFKKRS
ncbi:cytochrome P450 [Aspergillus ibericus CBS 121593]|uniref:Cytochrome P450 n=1 Tax=Aspergillus ibericus CBS 121593 TaxID=1448316 RepID=A0A395GT78_9EURO|nr:cytochrome P450 [Aspergillus ibericus CBS 121593]RAK97897.1 cytochrome P450 [Aspergillus ibericus CBS 121593]